MPQQNFQPVVGRLASSADLFGNIAGLGTFERLLAETTLLRDLYRKLQRQLADSHFYQLHLLVRKHGNEQAAAMAALAARAPDAARSRAAADNPSMRAPFRPETVSSQIARLLIVHEVLLTLAHEVADAADRRGDNAIRNLIVNDVIRPNEFQVWCLSEQQANLPRFSA